MFSGDREHIHHRLLRLGLSQRQVALALYGASVLLGAVALTLSFVSEPAVAWILVAVSLAAFLALRQLGFFRAGAQMFQLRRRNLALRSAVDKIAGVLRGATSVGDVLDSAKAFASLVSADRVRVFLESADVALHESVRSPAVLAPSVLPVNGHVNEVARPFLANFSLPHALGKVELEWHDGRAELDRDHEIAAEAMCGHIAHALRRVAPAPEPRRESRSNWSPIDPVVGSLPLAQRRDSDA